MAITFVSGFQRCGSSLMCQMLNAGGLTVFHDPGMGYPSFETHRQFDTPNDETWLRSIDGLAVKWLEPQRAMPADVGIETRVLWMSRDHAEQAKSAVKFMRACGCNLPRDARYKMAKSYMADEATAISAWDQRGEVLVLRFEELITRPVDTARMVQQFLGVPLDVSAMAGQVRNRPMTCLPYLLEEELIREAV
jgi:hypothetical protein